MNFICDRKITFKYWLFTLLILCIYALKYQMYSRIEYWADLFPEGYMQINLFLNSKSLHFQNISAN